jgi:lipopolysaccharide assembly outer membrane protein LptD (OstA)
LSNASGDLVDTLDAPQEEITGSARLHLTKNWSTTYALTRDLDSNTTRRQAFGLRYRDDCTLIELLYTKNRFNNDAILDNSGIGIRVSLLTLGDFGG